MQGSLIIKLLRMAAILGASLCLLPAIGAAPPALRSQLRDDAALRDVFFISVNNGFAAGDHGTILRTTDGGERWSECAVDATISFRSLSFISESEGWAAGSGTRPYSGQSFGAVYATTDGGATWTLMCDRGLAGLRKVQFFSDVAGVAIGDASERCPTGVWTTEDGGRTWSPVNGDASPGWTTAEFARPGIGLLVGRRESTGNLNQDSVERSPATNGLRSFTASSLDRTTKLVWAVGDGAMIRRTDDGGATWIPSEGNLPAETKMVFDFSTVAAFRGDVWVAGSPGCVVWHSRDGGDTWAAEPTGETTPLYCVRAFPKRRVAVGALGKILLSDDDGTWRTVRGAGRRLAALALHAHASRVSVMELSRDGLDRGYRVGAWNLVRRDVEPGTERPADGMRRFEDAVLATGGSCGMTDWRLPISLPGIDRQPQALLAEWSVLADQKLADVLVATIATQIRTWQPDVLLLDDPPPGDTPTDIIHSALAEVLKNSAEDRGRIQVLWQRAGLPPWQVKRVYSKALPGQQGESVIDPFEWLPTLGTSLNAAASEGASRLTGAIGTLSDRDGFHQLSVPGLAENRSKEFFAGLAIAPGSAARRASLPPRLQDDETAVLAAEKQRKLQKMSLKVMEQPGQVERLLGQVTESITQMPADQAALTLAILGDDLRKRGEWDAAESTFTELVTRFPAHPASRGAMRWLLEFWSSAELEYFRARKTQASSVRVEQASGTQLGGTPPVTIAGGSITVGDLQSVLGVGAKSINVDAPAGSFTGRRRLDAGKRYAQAMQVASVWKKSAPDEFESSDVQRLMAALYRAHGKLQEADAVDIAQVQNTSGASRRIGHGEIWLRRPSTQSLQSIYRAHRTSKPPILDGVLSDDCWQNAKNLRVAGPVTGAPKRDELDALDAGETNRDTAGSAFCLISYDSAYLYLAVNAPRESKLPKDPPSYAGRPYDADLDAFDRVTFSLDINRDYLSAYRLEIDQRGWTRDALWTNQQWNPKWHVACDADDRTWRAEAAIAWSELCPVPPGPDDTFALGVVRTMPGLGRQSWVWPATDPVAMESMGLLRFE